MTTPSPYRQVAVDFEERLRGVREDQWTLPTPCTDWNVRELVVHVIETHRRVAGIVVPDAGDVSVTDVELLPAWEDATARILAAIDDPVLAATPVQGRAGEQPFSAVVAGLLTSDTLCHTWDLSRATGQSEALDPEAVEVSHAMLRAIDAAIRVPGGFASAVTPAADADAQTVYLNFTGRVV